MPQERNFFHVKRNFMHRESFLILYLIFLINEEKEFRKNIKQILMKTY